ncbi:unnamed protein product [Malus baccata var. baccata]
MKLVSQATGRAFLLRDSKRFHDILKNILSCNKESSPRSNHKPNPSFAGIRFYSQYESGSSQCWGGENVRVCSDCDEFMKLVSQATGSAFPLRD